MVDKNLFLYDLAVAAIMKNEEPYVNEWLDYYLLAGVDHFYIYDNESTPEFKKILQPYIDAGIVTYTFYPGKVRQMEAYLDAVKRFKFQCRYMAMIDGDEFIFPKSKSTINEVVNEVIGDNKNFSGLAINWVIFGSNGQEKADLTRGVLERFTARAANVHTTVKTIINPRRVRFWTQPHNPIYFDGCFAVSENGNIVPGYSIENNTAEKICVNHYNTKSREEWEKKVARGRSDVPTKNKLEDFKWRDKNDVFDDEILKYRDARLPECCEGGGGLSISCTPRKSITPNYFQRLCQLWRRPFAKMRRKIFLRGKLKNF